MLSTWSAAQVLTAGEYVTPPDPGPSGTIFDLYTKTAGTKLKMWRADWSRRVMRGN